jgi:DHA2 family multidrug resistance protein-like MFS transporter
LIDFSLLSVTPIAMGIFIALVASMTLIGFELVLSQRLQLVLGKSPLEAGAFVLPISLGSFFAGPLAGY